MGHSYTELKRKFEEEWAKNLKLYIEAGMSQEFISAMREFDEQAFRRERIFQDRNPARIQYWDDPRIEEPAEYFAHLKSDLDTQLENLSSGLSQRATTRDKEILLLASIGYTQNEIAVKLHISQMSVYRHLHKLQKYLQRRL